MGTVAQTTKIARTGQPSSPVQSAQRERTTPQWYVYLLKCADQSLYCGVTTDLVRRLAQHNGELPGGARYTRGRRPCQLLAFAAQPSKSRALRLEYQIKHCPKAQKAALLMPQNGSEAQ
ncbi:MAG: GIY-YIG nuclease family protein [Desulfovibrio sp.]|nr:GIY-YIG nuclease family protein [Desulfovibrio sp.]